jgi:hypothetical protein
MTFLCPPCALRLGETQRDTNMAHGLGMGQEKGRGLGRVLRKRRKGTGGGVLKEE